MYGMSRAVNDHVFVALASRSTLQSLESQHAITADLVPLAESRQYIKKKKKHGLYIYTYMRGGYELDIRTYMEMKNNT